MSLLVVLLFVILPTVWIQNAMMLQHLRGGSSLLGIVVTSTSRGFDFDFRSNPNSTFYSNNSSPYRSPDGFNFETSTTDDGSKNINTKEGGKGSSHPLQQNHQQRYLRQGLASATRTRSLTPEEIRVVARLRAKSRGGSCRSLDLPQGPAWKHPKLSSRHSHALASSQNQNPNQNQNRKRGKDFDDPVTLVAIRQYPHLVGGVGMNIIMEGEGSTGDLRGFPNAIVSGKGQGPKGRPATLADVQERQREYHYALGRTLLHPMVKEVHLLMNDTTHDLPALLHGLSEFCGPPEGDLGKLRVRGMGGMATYGDHIGYANDELERGVVALMTNADIYPVGQGWGDLRVRHFVPRRGNATIRDPATIQRTRTNILYMLSRYTPQCPPLVAAGERQGWSKRKMCIDQGKLGSADGFLFRVPTPPRVAEELRGIPTHYWGAENRAAASFARAGYGRIYNPCNQLALWHNHCSGVRTAGPDVPRVNRGTGRSRTAKWVSCLDEVS